MENETKFENAGMSGPEQDVVNVQRKIDEFTSHWLNHKYLFPGFAVVVMGLIFLGMLVPSIVIAAWVLCGILFVSFAGAMIWKDRLARQLNAAMESAQIALKEYEKQKRRKKRNK